MVPGRPQNKLVKLLAAIVAVAMIAVGWFQLQRQAGRSISTPAELPSLFATSVHSKLLKLADRDTVPITIGEQSLTVEVVIEPISQRQGLSGRDEIGSDGMLFVYDEAQTRYFWMKQMRFPIDIVWINQGTVIGVTAKAAVPAPGTTDEELLVYRSPGAADLVLELPAGMAQAWDIVPGVELSLPE